MNFGTVVVMIISHQKYVGSYALLAISREPFELCPHFKSPPSVARGELSIDLTWLAHRPETQNPPLLFFSRTNRVLGEGGDKLKIVFRKRGRLGARNGRDV